MVWRGVPPPPLPPALLVGPAYKNKRGRQPLNCFLLARLANPRSTDVPPDVVWACRVSSFRTQGHARFVVLLWPVLSDRLCLFSINVRLQVDADPATWTNVVFDHHIYHSFGDNDNWGPLKSSWVAGNTDACKTCM